MRLTDYSIAEGGLVEELRKRAGSDEYLSNLSEERLPSEYYKDREWKQNSCTGFQ